MTLPRPVRAIAGVVLAALLWAVLAIIVIERCEENEVDWNNVVSRRLP